MMPPKGMDLKFICFNTHISIYKVARRHYKKQELQFFNAWMVPLRLVGLIQPAHDMGLALLALMATSTAIGSL